MAAIDNDAAKINAVNFTDQSGDPSAPAAGHTVLYTKNGLAYKEKHDATVNQLATVDGAETLTNKTLSGVTLADATNVILNATTGSKIGTATTQKLGFFNATPVAQPSAVGAATGFAAGTTAATFHEDDTYTGNVGSTAYTINGIVAALKNLGLLAQ